MNQIAKPWPLGVYVGVRKQGSLYIGKEEKSRAGLIKVVRRAGVRVRLLFFISQSSLGEGDIGAET